MKRLAFLFIGLLLLSSSAQAARTLTCASAARDDVNAVINGGTDSAGVIWSNSTTEDATHKLYAASGDTVVVPVGDVDWTGKAAVTISKNLFVLGGGFGLAGAGRTQITTDDQAFNFSTQYVSDAGTVTTPEVRLNGFKFVSTGATGSPNQKNSTISLGGVSQNVRLDHLYFSGYTDRYALWLSGYVYGVADQWVIDESCSPQNEIVNVGHGTTPKTNAGSYGDYSWTQPQSLGTPQEFYFENSIFFNHPFNVGAVAGTSNGGARYAFRHNYATAGGGGHGTESNGRTRGMRSTESYNNYYDHSRETKPGTSAANYRSASGNIFNNRYTAYQTNQEVSINNYRTGANFAYFNAGDGTGPWDHVDRSSTGPLGAGTGHDDGQNDSRRSFIYASGTASSATMAKDSSGNITGIVHLSGISGAPDNAWVGYTLRCPAMAYSGQTGGTGVVNASGHPNYYAIITASSNGSNDVTILQGRGGWLDLTPDSTFPSKTWEIRHVIEWLDSPGVGAQDSLVSGSTSPQFTSGTPNPRWANQDGANMEGIYQWNNKSRSSSTASWYSPTGCAAWIGGYVNFKAGVHYFDNTPRPSYPQIASPTLAERRIGPDWTVTDPTSGFTSPAAIEGTDSANYGLSTSQVYGIHYPHYLVSGAISAPSPQISSPATATFIAGSTGNSFAFKSANFSSAPAWAVSVTSVPSGATAASLPSNVSLNNTTGALTGSATSAVPGNYVMTVTASNSVPESASQTFTLVVSPNIPPTSSLTATANQNTSPANITLTATASDPNGNISQVEIYRKIGSGSYSLITTLVAAPYIYIDASPGAGTYTYYSRAWDNAGSSTDSSTTAPITIANAVGTPTPTPPTLTGH